jgi:spermidine synthase
MVFFLVSGSAGLVYEVVWTRMMILVFGSTSFAISTILTAFMGGLALGSRWYGHRADSLSRPLRTYGFLEIGIGLFALAVPLLGDLTGLIQKGVWDAFHPSFFPLSLVRFVLALGVFLIPTALMGATLPVLARFLVRDLSRTGFRVGMLYAVNTAGAVVGAGIAGFVLLPAMGMKTTVALAATANFVVGGLALLLSTRDKSPHTAHQGVPDEDPKTPAPQDGGLPVVLAGAETKRERWFAPPDVTLFVVFASGFGAMALQVVWNRVMGLLIGSSVYAFTIVLVSFLAGLALGTAVAAAAVRNRLRGNPAPWLVGVLGAVAVSVFLSSAAFQGLPYLFLRWAKQPGLTVPADTLKRFVLEEGWATPAQVDAAVSAAEEDSFSAGESRLSLVDVLKAQGVLTEKQQRQAGIRLKEMSARNLYGRYVAMQFGMAFLVLLLPTFFMGAVFPLALQLRSSAEKGAGAATGRLYAVNTFGAILGSFAGGFLLLPFFGVADTLWLGMVFYMALAALLAASRCRRTLSPRWAVVAVCVVAALGLPLVAPKWDALVMSCGIYRYAFRDRIPDGTRASFDAEFVEGNRLLFYRDGMTTTVTVVREKSGNVFMATNGKTDASTKGDIATQVLLGQIPMILAPCRDKVCVIGFASGVTAGSVLLHPVTEAVAVEIEPAVVEASHFFDEINGRPLDDPRFTLVNADGRNYLALTDRSFDVIISEPSNPWMTVASNLFTREFFKIGRRRLADRGIFCQWIQLYCLGVEDLRCLIATFDEVFEHTAVFFTKEMVDMLLVGSPQGLRFDVSEIRRRVADEKVAQDLDRVGVYGAPSLLAHFIIGPEEVTRFSLGATLNTDDNARIEFSSPSTLFTSFHVEIQQMMIESSGGLAPYLRGHGSDAREQASFLAAVAEAAMVQSDSLEGLARRFAQDSVDLDPEGEGRALLDALK